MLSNSSGRRVAALGAALVLAGCGRQAVTPPAAPAAASPAVPLPPAPPAPAAAAARLPQEILRQAVLVEPNKPTALTCQLAAGWLYVAYAGAVQQQDAASPTLLISDSRGEVLGRNDTFRNELFAALALRPERATVVTVQVGCKENRAGSVSARVQQAGSLAPGQSVDAVLADYQTYHFYAVEAVAGERYEARTSAGATASDTLLALHRLPDLKILDENDDLSEQETDSELLWQCHESGTYLLAVTSWTPEGAGPYRLSLGRLAPVP